MVDKYSNVLFMVTVVDCLGKSQPIGSIIFPFEDADLIVQAMDLFGVPRRDSEEGRVFHTDGAAWGPVVAQEFGMVHQKCSNHFMTKVRIPQKQTTRSTGFCRLARPVPVWVQSLRSSSKMSPRHS